MASNTFTGTVGTALTALDANWVSCVISGHDGIADLTLDGAGKLRTVAGKISDAVRSDGDGTSKSRITIAAGDYDPAVCAVQVACRRTTTTRGYDAEPNSSTGLATNINQVIVRRQGVLMETLSITAINAVTTALDILIQVVNTVDVRVIINAQTVNSTGSGANDHSGAAVLTGGRAGLSMSAVAAAPPSSGAILLDDFSNLRNNGEGTQLFSPYNGEDPNQTGSLVSSTLQLVSTSGSATYMHFVPRGSSGYNWPGGYAQAYVESGTFSATCNRLIMMVKCNTTVNRRSDGGSLIEIGTYIRDHASSDSNNQGAHYYHIIDPNVVANRWMKIILNRTPQHQVGQTPGTNWGDDPEAPLHYYDGLTRYYYDTQASGFINSTHNFGTVMFKTVASEPDAEISSLVAYYTGSKYHLSWAGLKNSARTYELRWKTSSMKTAGFASGTSAGTTTNPGNDYTGCLWELTSAELTNMYMAVRVSGGTDFTEVYIPTGMTSTNHGE